MRSQLNSHKQSLALFKSYGLMLILSIWAGVYFQSIIPLLIPILVIFLFQVLVDYEKIYLLLFLSIPLSTEVFISDHLATDFPTEPLIVGLMLLYVLLVLTDSKKLNKYFVAHPLSILILAHVGWTVLTTLTSTAFGYSFKFLLAKIWYIVTFFYLSSYMLKEEKKSDRVLWLIAIPLTLATIKVIVHHATLDFGFTKINTACTPFFRNHVSYAAILSTFLPFMWYLRKWAKSTSIRRWSTIIIFVLIFGILTAYTRAAYIAILLALIAFWIIRLNLLRLVVVLTTVIIAGVLSFLILQNRFMEYAPTQETIAHEELGDIISSTSELKDVSTMERYYRWVAGVRMVFNKPLVGFGPGNFYHFYKAYTLSRFETYVSDNPEKSGVHNYYLMIACEQGIIGLIIFILLVYSIVLYGQRIYHETSRTKDKDFVMAVILSSIIIDAFLLINDMIETDKIGSFFFLNIAFLVLMDLKNKQLNVGQNKKNANI